jgi:hypothetical protein
MSSSSLRFLFCAVVAAGLAGCGGSSKSGSGGGGGDSPTTVTYTFAGSPNGVAPAAVATQIGTGAYTLAAVASNKLTFTIPSGETNFSVAFVCPPPTQAITSLNLEYIQQYSTLDGTSFSGDCPTESIPPQTGLATLQVSAAAIPGAAGVAVDGYAIPWSSGTLDFSESLLTGTYDVPVTVSKGEYYDSFNDYLAFKILRAQTIPGVLNGGAPVVFGTGDETVTQTITYNNVPTGYTPYSPFVLYETAGGAGFLLNLDGPTGQYTAMPSDAFQSGDHYLIDTGASSAAGNSSVGAETYTSTGGPLSVTFPAPWTYAGPTAAALPTFNFVYSGFSGKSDVSQYVNLNWNEGTASSNQISMTATANYLSGSTSMTIPNLSSLTGFLAPATSGTLVNWNAEILEGNPFLTNPPSGTSLSVLTTGNYTEP